MKYHDVSFKASHNSYERNESIHEQLRFFPSDPSRCGCRGLEFDIWRHSNQTERFFTVSHSNPSGGYPLAYYLGLLLSFNVNQPQHDPIFVTIDIKSSNGSIQNLPQEIDSYFRRYFSEALIFKPRQLLFNRRLSLCENVIQNGWPDTSAMKGKFIFCLSGTASWKTFYANSGIGDRLCFSDMDIDDDDTTPFLPSRGNIVIFNMHIWTANFNTWKNTLPLYFNRNLLTRVYEADGEALWNKAQTRSATVIATNKVSGKSWAKVGSAAFAKRKVV